jgi:hypothetical protein
VFAGTCMVGLVVGLSRSFNNVACLLKARIVKPAETAVARQ